MNEYLMFTIHYWSCWCTYAIQWLFRLFWWPEGRCTHARGHTKPLYTGISTVIPPLPDVLLCSRASVSSLWRARACVFSVCGNKCPSVLPLSLSRAHEQTKVYLPFFKKFMVTDSGAFALKVNEILGWGIETIVPCHGEIVRSGATETLRETLLGKRIITE